MIQKMTHLIAARVDDKLHKRLLRIAARDYRGNRSRLLVDALERLLDKRCKTTRRPAGARRKTV